MCVKQQPFSSDARNQSSHTLFNSANFWLQMRVDANIWCHSFCKWVVFICGLGIFWKGQLKMKMSPSYHSAQCHVVASKCAGDSSLPQNNNCLCLIATYSPQLTWCSAKDMVLTSMFQGLVRLLGSWQRILCEVCTMDFHWHCVESLPYCESSFGRRRMLRVAKDKDLLRVSRCCDISKMWLCIHCSFWGLKKKGKKEKTCSPKCPQTLHSCNCEWVVFQFWVSFPFNLLCICLLCTFVAYDFQCHVWLFACTSTFLFSSHALNSPSLIALMCLTWSSLTRTHFSWCSTCCLCQTCPSLGLCAAVSAGLL